MSLTPSEADAAFSAYAFALCGGVPPLDNGRPAHISAALSLGAWHRTEPPLNLHTQSDILAAVTRMVWGEPAPPSSPPSADHDPMQAALEAYAEGRADERAALEAWVPGAIGPAETISAGDMRAWLTSRRASAPKRGMTAADVLARIARYFDDPNDARQLDTVVADLRRELEGTTQ